METLKEVVEQMKRKHAKFKLLPGRREWCVVGKEMCPYTEGSEDCLKVAYSISREDWYKHGCPAENAEFVSIQEWLRNRFYIFNNDAEALAYENEMYPSGDSCHRRPICLTCHYVNLPDKCKQACDGVTFKELAKEGCPSNTKS